MPEEPLAICDAVENDTPCISYHTLTGYAVPSTLNLIRNISIHVVVMLVDWDSTNNFVQGRLVKYLGLTVRPSPHLRVTSVMVKLFNMTTSASKSY